MRVMPPTHGNSRTYPGSTPRTSGVVKATNLIHNQAIFDEKKKLQREVLAQTAAGSGRDGS